MPLQLLQSAFIALLIDRYYDRLLPLLRQFLLIPNRNNKFMNLTENCSTPCFNQFCWHFINTWWFVAQTQRHLAQALVVLWHVFLPAYITNPMYTDQLREMVPPSSQNTMAACNHFTFLILYYISSRLVTLLESQWCLFKSPWYFISYC